MANTFSGGQSIGGGAYKGTPYDSRTGRPIVRSGGGGGGSSRPAPETSVVVRDINNGRGAEVIINGQGFSVVPGQVESFLKARGLSGGSYNQALEIARARDAEFAKEQMRMLEAQKQAEAEKRRIEQLAVEIRRQGAQERQKILMNERGERVRQTTTEIKKIEKGRATNALVWKYENLDTGEVRYRSYEGSGRRNIGGVDFAQQSSKQVQEIKNELTEAGLKPIVSNGQVVGFSDPKTLRNYDYSDSGIEEFNQARSDRDQMLEITRSGKLVNRIGDKIISFASKGDRFINNIAGTAKKQLSRVGIRAPSIPEKYTSAVKSYLKKAGLDKASFEKYQEKISKVKSDLNIQLQRIKTENQKAYEELVVRVRNANPNLTDYQLQQKIRREMERRSLLDATTAVSIYGNILIAHTANFLIGIGLATPELLRQVKSAPLATIVALPPAIVQGVKQDWKRVYGGGAVSFGEVVAEYYTMGKLFKIAKSAVKGGATSIAKILPGTRVLKNGRIVIRNATKAKPGLVLKSQTVASGSKSLSAQAKFAGRNVTAVTAQANRLTSLLSRKKIIRKPILAKFPGATFLDDYKLMPSKYSKILRKFDTGKRLTNKEFANVNMWLRKNVAPNITLLERSLYLDPASGLRLSRLGIQPQRTATLRDILRGNFTLWQKQGKPQILVFENAKIARFPKALRTIERKLKTGQKLTESELNKLIRWQVQTGSGKFKPIGSTIYAGGRELEITLAPGELIKRVKSLGRVFIDGRKVSIVSAEVFKPSKIILKQMRLAELGRLSKNAINKLNNFLSKKLGRKVRVETPEIARSFARKAGRMARRADPNIPVLRVRGSGIMVLRAGLRGLVARPSIRMPVRFRGGVVRGGRVVSRTGRFSGRVGRTTPRGRVVGGRVGRTSRVQKPVRGIRRMGRFGRVGGTQKKTIPRVAFGFRPQQLSRPVQTFYVVEKVRGKFRKLYPKPLVLKDARDYAVYSIDNKLSRTAFFVPLGRAKRVVRPPKNIENYASRNSFKVRPYRIRFGKRRQLVNGYIEKRRFFQDTSGERNALRIRRKISPQRSPMRRQVRVRPRKRMSLSQRNILIARLKRARAIRMRNLRRRR